MSIDHIGFGVRDFPKSRAFYVAALAPLGIGIVNEGDDWAMIGKDGHTRVWFGDVGTVPGPIHIAFAAANHEQVRAFYAAALEAGGRDNGGPGIRAHYHPNYYAAFVFDPDGHNVEAVCHAPEA
jgi:catechol 2,3-dioxygenase-like lactoylglutathione lyase family enzyme